MTRILGTLSTIWMLVASTAMAEESSGLVVVELYTSQGCSSCPPADAYMRNELSKRDDVIALALHVDYWDYIGWKDSFADPKFAKRQKSYARAAGHRSVYTPQMIVNGRDHVVGVQSGKLEQFIRNSKLRQSEVDVEISRNGGRVKIEATSTRPADYSVHVVQYRPSAEVSIKRGENAGKSITYTNVVRDWDIVAAWDGKDTLKASSNTDPEYPVVVLIQHEKGGPIAAAAQIK